MWALVAPSASSSERVSTVAVVSSWAHALGSMTEKPALRSASAPLEMKFTKVSVLTNTSQSPASAKYPVGGSERAGLSAGAMVRARVCASRSFSTLPRSSSSRRTGLGDAVPERTPHRIRQVLSAAGLSPSAAFLGGSSTMKTSWRSTEVIESFHSLSPRNSWALPRLMGVVVKSAWAKSCHGYGRDSSVRCLRSANAIQWVSSSAKSSESDRLLMVRIPGAAEIISPSHPRSPSPEASCHMGNHSPPW